MTEGQGQDARAGRAATLLIVAHVVFGVLFVVGAVLTLWTFARNSQTSVDCFGGSDGTCGAHHSYVLGATLLAVGFVGNLVAIAVAARLALRYGRGLMARLQRRGDISSL
ncbi:MAG: hypothetical protein QOD07_2690 [Frankiaceae bacterium]|nr:hypothetical protein [Frankiaceae bacterium]